ncbi:Endophilin-A [Gryllus bimaculatus]|nr:Endophilin-A [Gryllus bimaculatus]
MDEWTLNDLLECSVCLERLDTSSKVLPCQHTFCKKCLEEIVSTHKELRCPECRVLVDAKIDELPPNVLLMRILEGMRNAAPKKRSPGPNRLQGGSVAPVPSQQMLPPPQQQMTPLVHPCPKQIQPPQPCARAIYDYIAKEPGDLSFKKGDMILLRKKIDTNWYQGETGGHFGAFPLTYVQVITPLPNQIPQCKALYDFRMTNDDDEGCLTFNKGEVITVLRRIDENWAEGRLGDRIGIFPLAFVELNIIARALMKLSTNSQPGPSRLAPPTPTSEDTTPLIPTDHSTGHPVLGMGPALASPRAGQPQPPPPQQQPLPQLQVPTPASTPSITSTTTPHTHTQAQQPPATAPPPSSIAATASGSLTGSEFEHAAQLAPVPAAAARSPIHPQPQQQQQQPPCSSRRPPAPAAAASAAAAAAPVAQTHAAGAAAAARRKPQPPPRAPSPPHSSTRQASTALARCTRLTCPPLRHRTPLKSSVPERRGRSGNGRGAGGAARGGAPRTPGSEHHRRGGGGCVGAARGRRGRARAPRSSTAPDLCCSAKQQAHRRTASGGDKLGSGVTVPPPQGVGLGSPAAASSTHLPAAYIALYPYKPQKADELELKKGGVYLVTERCEDGWFKGTSNRTQKCGVFPGNYVTPANTWTPPAQLSQLRLTRVSITSAPPTSSTGPASPRASGTSGATPPLEPRISASNYARGKSGSSTTLMPYSPRQLNGIGGQQQQQPPPPELPPRAASPSHNALTGVSSSWHGQPAGVVASSSASAVPDVAAVGSPAPTSAAPLGRSLSAVLGPGLASAIAAPPNTSISTVSPVPREKGKEKKDKAVSLMRRLTSIKKSKSPPPATYSMDNPVFEDGTVAASPVHPSHPVHPVHVRSGSCPSQLLQALPLDASSAHHRLFGSGSQRLKHKDRPNVVMANLAHFGRTGDPGPVACSSAANHRKSNSLDAGSGDIVRKVSKQLVPPVRERFRCIVPYPPMSEHELELRVGDIIYVHRKRDDGWYKGTQQRTGRTGLFPASFVESF